MSESQTCGKQNILVVTFTAAWTTVKINTMNGVDVHVNNKKISGQLAGIGGCKNRQVLAIR